MAVATAAAPPATVLFSFALGGAGALALLHLRLLRLLRIAGLLRFTRLLVLRWPGRPLLVGTALAALAVAAVALATRLPVPALLEPALLLAVAVPVAPFALPVTLAVAASVAPSVAPLLVITPRLALPLRPLLLALSLRARRRRCRRGLGGALEQA